MRITWREATGERRETYAHWNNAGNVVTALLAQTGDQKVEWITVANEDAFVWDKVA